MLWFSRIRFSHVVWNRRWFYSVRHVVCDVRLCDFVIHTLQFIECMQPNRIRYMYIGLKVALANLRTELTWFQNGRYTAMDWLHWNYLCHASFLVLWCILGVVCGMYVYAGRPVGPPDQLSNLSSCKNGVSTAVVAGAIDSFVVLKYYAV